MSGKTRSALLFVAAAAGACAQSTPPDKAPMMTLAAGTDPAASTTTSDGDPPDEGGPGRDREALAALSRMGKFLRSLTAFAVSGETTTDEILDTGQKIQFDKKVDLWVRRPDRLRASAESDAKRRDYFYDGKTFTLYSPRIGYYAEFVAPKTIIALLDIAEQRYGIDMPLVDLFRWGADDAKRVKAAIDLGPSRIDGVETQHYAYREEDVDFQIWIERGERPLPRKLVITTLSEPSQPQYSVTFAWNLDVTLTDKDFAFIPPQGAERIVFEVMNP